MFWTYMILNIIAGIISVLFGYSYAQGFVFGMILAILIEVCD